MDKEDGFVLEVLVQKRHDTKAVKRFIRKQLTSQSALPRVIITDKLGTYSAPVGRLASPPLITFSIRARTIEQIILISSYEDENDA